MGTLSDGLMHMNAKIPMIVMIMLLVTSAPLVLVDGEAADTHIGGTGHGDGIDVEYIEDGSYEVCVTLVSRPSADVRVSILSATTTQSIEPIGAAKVFWVYVERLDVGQYTLLVTRTSDNVLVAECILTVGLVSYAYYDSNGGTGTMFPSASEDGKLTLAECIFGAPSGKSFKAWSVGGTEYSPGSVVSVSGDINAKAVWKDGPAPEPGGSDDSGMMLMAVGIGIALVLLILIIFVLIRRKK